MAPGWRNIRFDSTALICGAVLLLAAVAARLPVPLPPLCPSVRWFGLECPGCGLTRAFMALTRGEVSSAWSLHPWSLLLFPLAVYFFLRPLLARWRKPADPATLPNERALRRRSWAVHGLMVGFALWAVARALHRI